MERPIDLTEGDLRRNMRGRRMLRVSDLPNTPRKELENQMLEWVTIAVLASKSATKRTAKGKTYQLWTLSDLAGTSVSVFLFDTCKEKHWQMSIGSMVVVINPRVLPARERGSVALSVSEPTQIARCGRAADFALCRATTKSGGQVQERGRQKRMQVLRVSRRDAI